MIRVMTEENFTLLDSQIERAYRRRCARPAADLSGAVLRIVEHDIALLQALRSAQMQAAEETRWMRRLRSDIARLERENACKPQRNARRPPAVRRMKAEAAGPCARAANASCSARQRRSRR